MIGIAFAMFATQVDPDIVQEPGVTVQKGLSVSIPSEIAPAIKPYLDCLVEADNEALTGGAGSDGASIRAIAVKSRETCLPGRKFAVEQARQLLAKHPERSQEANDKMIESALQSAESLSSAMADMMDQARANLNGTKNTNAPNP